LIQKINHHKVASIIYRPELIERDSVKDLSVHDD